MRFYARKLLDSNASLGQQSLKYLYSIFFSFEAKNDKSKERRKIVNSSEMFSYSVQLCGCIDLGVKEKGALFGSFLPFNYNFFHQEMLKILKGISHWWKKLGIWYFQANTVAFIEKQYLAFFSMTQARHQYFPEILQQLLWRMKSSLFQRQAKKLQTISLTLSKQSKAHTKSIQRHALKAIQSQAKNKTLSFS